MTKIIYVPTKTEFDRFQKDFGFIVSDRVYEDFIMRTTYCGEDRIVIMTIVLSFSSIKEYQELGYEIITY